MAINDRRIEVFAPFGEAFELMQKILFRPFDIGKWFVIGFAAWLATFFSGGGGFHRWWNKGDWHWRAHHEGPPWSLHDSAPWVIPVFLFGFLIVLALAVIFIWLNSRGRFMFVDCIVRNRGAIAEPWREYATEANGFFVFQLVIGLCSLVLVGGFALLFFVSSHAGAAIIAFPLLILFAVAFVLVAIVVALVTHFMVPVMYRQRCGAMEAFRAVWSLVVANLGEFILFALFLIVLYVAAAAIGCLAGCVTCCVAALPYIGTVILLPIVLTLYAFPLCFLRQFGDQYDVFAVVRPTEPPPPPPVPPVQESLPPSS
jgi:hypothetical protein